MNAPKPDKSKMGSNRAPFSPAPAKEAKGEGSKAKGRSDMPAECCGTAADRSRPKD